jgi:hypothetical protein
LDHIRYSKDFFKTNTDELLEHILLRFNSGLKDAETISPEEISDWPPDVFDSFCGQGIVIPCIAAQSINCDACSENHAADVQAIDYNGQLHFFINCPSCGRVEIQAERLRRWRLSLLGLARVIALKLETKGPVKELVSQRQWDIGRAEIGGSIHEFLVLRGLNWKDSSDVFEFEDLNKTSPVFLSLSNKCDMSTNLTSVYLGSVLSVSSKGLTIDLPYLKTLILSHKEDYRADYMFKREGDGWGVCFEGNHISVKHSLGLTYIGYLLANPEQDVSVFDLVSLERKDEANPTSSEYSTMTHDQLEAEGMSVRFGLGDAGEILDAQAKKQFKERLDDIREELAYTKANGDICQAEKLENEKDAIMQQLNAAIGLGGRGRKAGSVAERARISVSQNIHKAIKNMSKHDQKLAQFLNNSIKTGITCKYAPDQDIPWIFS